MNPVGDLLSIDDIDLDLDLSGKGAVLQWIAATLARRHHLSEAEVLESLTAREALGSTAVGHGVAIPHARMSQCSAAAGVFVRTSVGIPFDASDGKPVSLFLGLIVPKQANERHLKLLATAAAMFSDRSFRDQIKACTDANSLQELLAAWPHSPPSEAPDKPSVV
jgi:nitrogen PTS system EIIA component